MESVFGVDYRRELPKFPEKSWEDLYREERRVETPPVVAGRPPLAILADVFTNFGAPERGMAAIRVLRKCGYDVELTPSLPDGRAALSQGMIDTARQQAEAMVQMLRPYVDAGRKLVVVEPSVLAMFRFDLRHLVEDQAVFDKLRSISFEPLQLVWQASQEFGLDLHAVFPAEDWPHGTKLFYHSHCQQRTCNAASETIDVLTACGFDVATSSVECCGMAGSFGYKADYYELSMAVGEDLFAEIREAEAGTGPGALVASGVSCQEQLWAGFQRPVHHPVEILDSVAR
jgi:Fe-S oxidoreductase